MRIDICIKSNNFQSVRKYVHSLTLTLRCSSVVTARKQAVVGVNRGRNHAGADFVVVGEVIKLVFGLA